MNVDGAFLGLRVPPGRHTLSLRYFSTRIVLGYRIAFATAIVLIGSALLRVARFSPRRRSVRVALGAAVLTALAGIALPAYSRWERSFEAKARKEATLNHNYAHLLEQQLERWRGSEQP